LTSVTHCALLIVKEIGKVLDDFEAEDGGLAPHRADDLPSVFKTVTYTCRCRPPSIIILHDIGVSEAYGAKY
jgi:hypothetical protein